MLKPLSNYWGRQESLKLAIFVYANFCVIVFEQSVQLISKILFCVYAKSLNGLKENKTAPLDKTRSDFKAIKVIVVPRSKLII